MTVPAIEVEGLWKRYGVPIGRNLRAMTDRWFQRQRTDENVWALRDLSFTVNPGETLGVIGRNGAGKSTLLKVLAGVTPATRGRIAVNGSVFPMIELNAGISRELTGRENIYFLGAIMGLNRKAIQRRMDDIESFMDLGVWLDRPVRQYSSGMYARLGFGVAVNVDADILLIDEVLSVGDIAFQKKCLAHIDKLVDNGVAAVFVSHSPYAVARVCARAILLNRGQLIEYGTSSDILAAYLRELSKNRTLDNPSTATALSEARPGTGEIRITRFWVTEPETRLRVQEISSNSPVLLSIHLESHGGVSAPVMAIRLYDSAGTLVLNWQFPEHVTEELITQESLELECLITSLPLLPGIYSFEFICKEASRLVDHLMNAAEIIVKSDDNVLLQTGNLGLIHVSTVWNIKSKEETIAENKD